MEILRTENLKKYYDQNMVCVKALDGVDLSVEQGEFVAIVGTSGSGKSTLLHMLGGLDRPTAGTVLVDGKKIFDLKEEELTIFRRRKIGFVFQAYHLIPRISIEENILCPSYINGKQYDKEYYHFLIEILGIEKLLKKMPYELSGGEQQRVAIARAMLLKPKIVFADEPTGNLDTENTKVITELFQKLNKEYKTTFIIVTHEENLIGHCEQIIRLRDGEIVIE